VELETDGGLVYPDDGGRITRPTRAYFGALNSRLAVGGGGEDAPLTFTSEGAFARGDERHLELDRT
jgi:hypothetical protein